jgi:hypothetical protein
VTLSRQTTSERRPSRAAAGSPAGLHAEAGHQIGRQHHFERHRDQAEDQRDLGEGDGPADLPDVEVDGQLLGQEETDGQQRARDQQLLGFDSVGVAEQHGRRHTEASQQDRRGEQAVAPGTLRIKMRADRRAGHLGMDGTAVVGHPPSSSGHADRAPSPLSTLLPVVSLA